jgi:hypothetical protein
MHRVPCLLAVATLALGATRGARAQTLASVTNPALPIPAPNESQYDAGASLPTSDYIVATTCRGTGPEGCRLFFQYGSNSQGQQVDTVDASRATAREVETERRDAGDDVRVPEEVRAA